MGANKKVARPGVRAWKPITVISCIVIGVFILIFAGLYVANRPNYRDLEKEFKKISANIPSDWQLVSESSNKGTWGLFCLQIEGETCPHLIVEYSRNHLTDKDPETIIKNLQDVLANNGLIILNDGYQKCTESDITNLDYSCSASGRSGNIRANISVSATNPNGKKGEWGSISISVSSP